MGPLVRQHYQLIELALLALLAPLTWAPWRWPALTLAALIVIPLLWLFDWYQEARLTTRSGVEAPLCYVLGATCLATVPIVDWQAGLPRVLGLALGVAALLAVTKAVSSAQTLTAALSVLAAGTLLLAGGGLIAMKAGPEKLPFIGSAVPRLHAALQHVTPQRLQQTIHPNILAAMLVLLVPPLLVQVVGVATPSPHVWRARLAALAGAFGLAVVVATQSRSGLIGVGAALLTLGGWAVARRVRSRGVASWQKLLLCLCSMCVLAASAIEAWQLLVHWTGSTGGGAMDSFEGRLEVWDRALSMIEDFAFTGIGLGQFNVVLHALYVPFLVAPSEVVPHAHNLYLEYAAELGIPGAAAFACVVVVCLRRCWRAMHADDSRLRHTAAGLAAALVGLLTYGLTDSTEPGARTGIIMWIVLGLAAAVGNLAHQNRSIISDHGDGAVHSTPTKAGARVRAERSTIAVGRRCRGGVP